MADSAIAETEENEIAEKIVVRGLVQGVGFRPAVWRLAQDFKIRGTIFNNGDGVEIYACGAASNIENFIAAIQIQIPPLARIDEINRTPTEIIPHISAFQIAESKTTEIKTGVVPDATICAECQAEIFDAAARRFRYPFTNCTNCGPRFSIIENVPYDRANTTMREFEMCEDCRIEYENPADRRFHAQPIACHKCGPKVWLEPADGKPTAVEEFKMLDAADAVGVLIERGFIVAVKGIGGFQLACDAMNEEAVSRLRRLKHREMKPFALMVRDLHAAREFCEISDAEAEILRSSAAPIVIVNQSKIQNPKSKIAAGVAPNINTLGVMLPNTPLHRLLMRRMSRPIILTSGNLSDEPQCVDNAEAVGKLGHIADFFLTHNRPIARRVDDSVVKIMADEPRVLRRARGYAPATLKLPKGFENAAPLLAFGSELKNTFCLLRDGSAIVSQHIGDLEDFATQTDYRRNLKLYETLYRHQPEALVCDLHPEYLSSKLAREQSVEKNLPLLKTQHHHAHIASCLAENGAAIDAEPIIGVALDGLGFGDDGTFWGGEFLLADYADYKRLATFKPVAMIGGEQAIKEPWRNAYAHLTVETGWAKLAMNYADLELFDFLDQKPRAILDRMTKRGVNSPPASSCGRLFDAVAAAIGIAREHAVYEGQGAVELEQIVDEKTWREEDETLAYPFAIQLLKKSNLPYIEPYQMWQALLHDLVLNTPKPIMAARFHKGLAKIIVRMIEKLSGGESVEHAVKTVALSGGVWQNKILFEEVIRRLRELEFTVLTHRQFPANDGGLSLGQATIATAKLRKLKVF